MESKTIILIILGGLFLLIFLLLPISSCIAYMYNQSSTSTTTTPPTVVTNPTVAKASNGLFIKGGDNVVYYVSGDRLHKFTSTALANRWGINNVSNTISTITSSIALGDPISTEPVVLIAYEGKVVMCSNGNAIFYIENGAKRWITTAAATNRVLNGGQPQVIDCALLWNAPNGANLTA